MNVPMIRTLVLKDWHFLRWPIFGYLIGGVVALVLISTGGEGSFYAGAVLLVGVIISVGIHLTMLTVVEERTQQTLPFVMSLPISPSDYTVAKIVANVLIFMIPWIALLIGTVVVIIGRHGLPHGLVPFAVITLTEIFLGYVLTLAAAIIGESIGWAIVAMILANGSFQATMYLASHAPGIAGTMHGAQVVWSQTALATLAAEAIAIVALIALTFFVQSRKTDFV
jgi:ABC-2 type transport system permease protein